LFDQSSGRVRDCELKKTPPPKASYIWLAVNDVVDPGHPELFLEDNVGYFRVVVTIEKDGYVLDSGNPNGLGFGCP